MAKNLIDKIDSPVSKDAGEVLPKAPHLAKGKAPKRKAPSGPIDLPHIKKIIAITSGKGGVGKSTLAYGLAKAAAESGLRVGLLDADISGPSLPILADLPYEKDMVKIQDSLMQPLQKYGITMMSVGFLLDPTEAMAWRGPMVMGALRQLLAEVNWRAYQEVLDVLFIDTPPGTGDAHLTLIQKLKLDGAVVVTTPHNLAVSDILRGMTLLKNMDVPILGLVENMTHIKIDNKEVPVFGQSLGQGLAVKNKCPWLGAVPLVENPVDNIDFTTILAKIDI